MCSGPGHTAACVPFLLLFLLLDSRYLTPLVCTGLMALTPVWVLVAKKNPPIMQTLKFGWFPIILAMVISR